MELAWLERVNGSARVEDLKVRRRRLGLVGLDIGFSFCFVL